MSRKFKAQPTTGCLYPEVRRAVACDDYITDHGEDRSCCEGCGWNPAVAERRKAARRGRKK